jgi:6-pyruvoyltetrahydropterin/6-carboxytetrahydropterin synthase
MYTLAVRRDFIARHALIGGDWGLENQPHAHHYVLEFQMTGDTLDRHGFLVDIVEMDQILTALTTHYRDHFLNDLPEFNGLNPSLENFSRIICNSLNGSIRAKNIASIKTILWENDSASAAYQVTR